MTCVAGSLSGLCVNSQHKVARGLVGDFVLKKVAGRPPLFVVACLLRAFAWARRDRPPGRSVLMASPGKLQRVFAVCDASSSSDSPVVVRDVRLSADGTVTLVGRRRGLDGGHNGSSAFCSVLVGADCHTEQMVSCFCLDEFVDGALYNLACDRVVVWSAYKGKNRSSGSSSSSNSENCTAFHIFETKHAVPCAQLLCRFTIQGVRSEGIRRVVWASQRVYIWTGSGTSGLNLYCFNTYGRSTQRGDDSVTDAAGLNAAWESAHKVAIPFDCDIDNCDISVDGSWALLRFQDAAAGGWVWHALPLNSEDAVAKKVRMEKCSAACFGATPRGTASSNPIARVYVLEPSDTSDAVHLILGELGRNEGTFVRLGNVELPWLAHCVMPVAQRHHLCGIAVKENAELQPLAIWVRTEAGAIHRACDEAIGENATLVVPESTTQIVMSSRGAVVECEDGAFCVAMAIQHSSDTCSTACSRDDQTKPAAMRPIHWNGAIKRASNRHARFASHPGSQSIFSFTASVREQLLLGSHLAVHLIKPLHHEWSAACLDRPALMCFRWDRTCDDGGWPEGHARFFRYGRYRVQNLTKRPDLQVQVPSDPGLIMTEAMTELVNRLLEGYKHAHPVLLEGEAAGGKTAAVAFCANRTNSPLIRFNMTPHTTIADFVGQLGLSGGNGFSFCLGPFAEAVKDGLWLLLDEANLAPDSVLRVIEDVLAHGCLRIGSGGVAGQPGSCSGQLTIPKHPNFRLFATQNSASDMRYGTTRHMLSVSLLSHFVPVVAPRMEFDQVRAIITDKLLQCVFCRSDNDAAASDLLVLHEWAPRCADALMEVFIATNEAAKAEPQAQAATLRDMLQAALLIRVVLEGKHRPLRALDGLKAIFTQRLKRRRSVSKVARLIGRHAAALDPLGTDTVANTTRPAASSKLAMLPEHQDLLGLLDVGHATGKPILICGPDMSGKASSVLLWCEHRSRSCHMFVLTPESSAEDLFGKLVPQNDDSSLPSATGHPQAPFRWEAGPVTKAMERGEVLLLRGIDAPDPAVLESLNAVLEIDATRDASSSRTVLANGRLIAARPGFHVICTSRTTHHSLTPALSSRFLSVRWGGDSIEPNKWTGLGGFEALVRTYTCDLVQNHHERVVTDSVRTALQQELQLSEKPQRYSVGEVAFVLRALRAWWYFMTSPLPFGRKEPVSAVVERVGRAAHDIAKLLHRAPSSSFDLPLHLPLSLRDVRPELNDEAVYNATGFALSGTSTPGSRRWTLDLVLTGIKCAIPLILEGPAGVGKTKLIEVAYRLDQRTRDAPPSMPMVQFSKSTTLQDLIGQWRPVGSVCKWVDGPLYTAMKGGYPLLCDEMNLASSEIICFLVPLLDHPSHLDCPCGSGRVQIAPGFVIIAAQNPSHFAGRNRLPLSFTQRAVCIHVHPYLESEVMEIATRRVKARYGPGPAEAAEMPCRLLFAMHTLGYTDTALAAERSHDVTLRHVLKLLGRLLEPAAWAIFSAPSVLKTPNDEATAPAWRDLVRLHANIIFPEHLSTELQIDRLHGSVTPSSNGDEEASFRISALGQAAEVFLPMVDPMAFADDFSRLPARAQLLVCKLAFCIAFREPVLVSGPSCFKSHCIHLLGRSVRFQAHSRDVNTISLSRLTESADLVGSIEPHSRESFIEYLLPRCLWIQTQSTAVADGTNSMPPSLNAGLRPFLVWHANRRDQLDGNLRSNARWCATMLQELDAFETGAQSFPFCERGVMQSVRFGGLLLLESFEQPDQAVIEGLNALLELDRSFRSGCDLLEATTVHDELIFVATCHAAAKQARTLVPEGLSAAVVSRLTLICVSPPPFSEMETEFTPLLLHKIGMVGRDRAVAYMFEALRHLQVTCARILDQITLRLLLQWCNFSRLRRGRAVGNGNTDTSSEKTLMENMVLGLHVLLFDRLDVPQRLIITKSLEAVENNHVADPSSLHADPTAGSGQYSRERWVYQGEDGSRRLAYLGLEVDTSFTDDLGTFEPSFTSVRSLSRMLMARDTGHAINLVGPPGIGKSAVAEVAARLLRRPYTRISCSRSLTLDDLFGSYKPVLDPESGQILFLFQKGPLAAAIEQEGLVLFDELNLAPDDVLGVIHTLLSTSPEHPFETRNQRLLRRGTIFVAAMNDASIGGGRHELPQRLADVLVRVNLLPLEPEEVSCISHGVCGRAFARATMDCDRDDTLLDLALELNSSLTREVPAIDVSFNLRTLQNLAATLNAIEWERCVTAAQRAYLTLAALMLVYTLGCNPRFRDAAERSVMQRFSAFYGDQKCDIDHLLEQWRSRTIPFRLTHGALHIGPVCSKLSGGATWSYARLPQNDDSWGDATPSPQHGSRNGRLVEMLSLACESRRLVMLEGPACSGKTSAVRDLAWLRNARLLTIAVDAETEVSDLLGGFAPTCDSLGEATLEALNMVLRDALRSKRGHEVVARMLSCVDAATDEDERALAVALLACGDMLCENECSPLALCLKEARDQIKPADGSSRLPFRIYEGPLLVAMRRGYWLLLDNVNAASPEVIERINSLGEADAALHMFESCEGKLRPHTAFRLFATATTKRASAYQLSDAFRNRCIIIQCEPLDYGLTPTSSASTRRDASMVRREAYEALELLARSHGCHPRLAHELVRLHEMALGQAMSTPNRVCGYEVTVRNLSCAAQMVGRGAPVAAAIKQAYDTMAPILTNGFLNELFDGLEREHDASFGDDISSEQAARRQDISRDAAPPEMADTDDTGQVQEELRDYDALRDSATGSVAKEDATPPDGDADVPGGGGADGDEDGPGSESDDGFGSSGEDEVVEDVSKSVDIESSAGSGSAASKMDVGGTTHAGGTQAAKDENHAASNGLKQAVHASASKHELEYDNSAYAGATANVSIEAEEGDHSHILDDPVAANRSDRGTSTTALQAPQDPDISGRGDEASFLGRHEVRQGQEVDRQAPRSLSEEMLELVDAMVARLAQQVLVPAFEGMHYCRLEEMAARIRHRRVEHEAAVEALRDEAKQARARIHGREEARSVNAALDEQERSNREDERSIQLEREARKLRSAYARASLRAASEFEAQIDAFESQTAEMLGNVVRGTSIGVTMDSITLAKVQTHSLEVATQRLADVLAELRLKQAEDMALRDEQPTLEVRGLRETVDISKLDDNDSRDAESTSKVVENDGTGGRAALSDDSGVQEQGDVAASDGSAPLVDMKGPAAATSDSSTIAESIVVSKKIREAAMALQASLLSQRADADDSTSSETAIYAVQVSIVIDASLLGSDAGLVHPTIMLLLEGLQLCNFDVEICLSGPREVISQPLLMKHAGATSMHATRKALERILCNAPASSYELQHERKPDLLLHVTPFQTIGGHAFPLESTSPVARDALKGTRLGLIRVGAEGALAFDDWSIDASSRVKSTASPSLEALLLSLQPPRCSFATSTGQSWREAWQRWAELQLPVDDAVSALRCLQDDMRSLRSSAIRGIDAKEEIFGEDTRRSAAPSAGAEQGSHEALDSWLTAAELRSELASHQEMRPRDAEVSEREGAWQAIQASDALQSLTDEIVQALCSMPPNAYTQYSMSSQGKVLSIPALVKRYILGDSVTAIWKKLDRGAKRRLAVSVVLDLTSAQTLDPDFVCGIFALIGGLCRMQYAANVVAFNNKGVWVVHVADDAFGAASKSRLLLVLAMAAGTTDEASGTTKSPGICYLIQAISLAAQLLLTSQSVSSPRMIWLIASGAAHCSRRAVTSQCATLEARQITVVALSLSGVNLAAVGYPRWLACSGPARLPDLMAMVFDPELQPQAPVAATSAPSQDAAATIRACASHGSSSQAFLGGRNNVAQVHSKTAPCFAYLSGALDYVTSPSEREEDSRDNKDAKPPPPEDPMDDEIEAFFKKVKSSWKQVRTAIKLTWSKRNIAGPHDAAIMGRVFCCEIREASPWNLRHLSLESNQLGDAGMATFSWALSKGALSRLTRLTLTWNHISHAGIIAFATALKAGALPQLEWLFLNGNQIDDAGAEALATALAGEPMQPGSSFSEGDHKLVLANLQQLWLHENSIGDAGIAALLKSVSKGALGNLTTLSLDHNRIRRSGITAVVDALAKGALPKCKNLLVSDNPAGVQAQQQVADALAKRASRKK